MAVELTTVVNGQKYCLYCMKSLKKDENCTCKASLKALENERKKEARANLPDHRFDRPPRRQTMK